jgi:methionyl-tRNA formyltransferase
VVRILLVGNVEPQSSAVRAALPYDASWCGDPTDLRDHVAAFLPHLIIVAGWRHLIPPDVLAIPRLGTVGFHSAKLPEYPGRAPVAWTHFRGDAEAWTTLFYLDEGVDSGDIIDARAVPIGYTPAQTYERLAQANVELLMEHLPGILAGTAPRTPQDPAKRGPLTTKDGWNALAERERLGAGHG